MSSRIRRYAKAAASLVLLVLIAAACSSDGLPESYDAQPVELEDGTIVSNVEQNWLEGCQVGLADSDLAVPANKVCACSYATISSDGGIAFEDFVELNNELKGDPGSLATSSEDGTLTPVESQLLEIVKGCIATG